jgi:hypothetical protein
MNNNEKLKILISHLNSFDFHIKTMEEDMALWPEYNIPGKPPRSEVLAGFREKKAIIENMIATLTEEETL